MLLPWKSIEKVTLPPTGWDSHSGGWQAVGEGMDLRFDNASVVAGGALLARDRIIHLVAFAMAEPSLRGSDRVYRRRQIDIVK